ncbi:hypothetical protein IQ13_1301 [Lacibacter cauensis]|uniref:Uncharacterized protein n=1 Tax=Lacibacter cauensis TaxID=510947 RepID=A0A562SPI6_9BACT|nr:hypothetical protein [Lacibacter cauensis]TWI83195.1 hypothetical protein IQ13_1301 [Lacibacter cauensis]
MGVIILFYLAGAFAAFGIISHKLVYLVIDKEVKMITLFLGTLIFLLSYFSIFAFYMFQKEAYAFGSFFLFPFVQVYCPAVIVFILNLSKSQLKKEAANVLSVSVVLSFVSYLVFYKYTLSLPATLGIQITH